MNNGSILTELADDRPLPLLKELFDEQRKTTLALEQLEKTQKELIGALEYLKSSQKLNNSDGLGNKLSDFFTFVVAMDSFSGNAIGRTALGLAQSHPIGAGIVAAIVSSVYGYEFLQHQVETGELILDIDQSTAQANAMDSILAASNPFIFQGEDELAPGRKGGRAGRRLDEFKRRQETIEQATATLNTIGDIYAASNPHLYQPTASFNAWQTNQPQPTATFDGWQQQQTQLADIQAQTTQFWQTYSESTQNQPITLNVTNNFKGVTQDRKSLSEISDYMARQIIDGLNAGRPLYSHN